LSGKPPKSFSIPSRRTKDLVLTFTEADRKKIEKLAENTPAFLHKLVNRLRKPLAVPLLETLKDNWPKHHAAEMAMTEGFRQRLRRTWKKPLDLLGMLLAIAMDLGGAVNIRLRDAHDLDCKNLIEVQTRLHARACQVTREIITLLSDGFADAAMARWRTLHEIAVTASFIQQQKPLDRDELAKRYLLHANIQSVKAAREYQKNCAALRQPRLSDVEMKSLEDSYDNLIARFGKGYRTDYGWAGGSLPNPEPSFSDIEQATRLSHLRPYFRLASHNVHANPKGILFKLGLLKEDATLLAGHSNFGLADPGQSAALSLTQVSASLINIRPILDDLVTLEIMLKLSKEAAISFVKTQRAIEARAQTNRGAKSFTEAIEKIGRTRF
jgi:Family of unknown function (DUF5677)